MSDYLDKTLLVEFVANNKYKKAIMGIDFGEKRIGIAVSDLAYISATPYTIIENKGFRLVSVELEKIIKEKEIGFIVLGLPFGMDRDISETGKKILNFAKKIEDKFGIPYSFVDESYSSSIAEEVLISGVDMSRAKRKKVLDKMAASVFLQDVLDNL